MNGRGLLVALLMVLTLACTDGGDGDTWAGETGLDDGDGDPSRDGETGTGGAGESDEGGDGGVGSQPDTPVALTPIVCYDEAWSTCEIEFSVCTAPNVPACVSGAPLTCTELAGLCLVAHPGEECPQGWVDACEQYP